MQALLITTGDIQKLKPLAARVTSPMLPLMNRPIMLYNVELLGRLGIKLIMVSLNTMDSSIENYFGNGQKWGVSLEYIFQGDVLGSAGVLRSVKDCLHGTVMVLPADEIVDLEIAQAIRCHCVQKAQATVIVQPGTPLGSRALLTDTSGRVLAVGGSFLDRMPSWTDTGVYLFERQILDLIPPHSPFEIHQHLLPLLLSEGIPVWAHSLPGYWNPLDTLQKYVDAQYVFHARALRAETQFEKKITYRYHSLDAQQIARGIWVGRSSLIHSRIKMTPPVSIGQNSSIGRDVELGPFAFIGSNVVIDQGATIQNSIIFDHTYVGKLVNLDNRMVDQDQLIDLNTKENIRVNNPILLGKASSQFLAKSIKRVFDCFLALLFLLLSLPVNCSLAVLLLLTTGRILKKLPCRSPRTIRASSRPDREITFDLLHFNTQRKDGRPFWFGRWLESWEGERLPELVNIIKGDLALVGLRPIVTEMESKQYAAWLLEQDEVAAGFSGLWYVQTGKDSSLAEKLVADAYYFSTRSWSSDIKILWSTPVAWFERVRSKSVIKT